MVQIIFALVFFLVALILVSYYYKATLIRSSSRLLSGQREVQGQIPGDREDLRISTFSQL